MPARRKPRATKPRPPQGGLLERVAVTTEKHSWPDVHVVRARVGRREVGYMEIGRVDGPHGKALMKVDFVEVKKKGIGVGTKIYEKAAAFACSHGAPLASDEVRTAAAQGFWTKQARKGRATCLRGSGRATKLSKTWKEAGQWGCGQYVLTCPAPKSLAAARRVR